MWAGVTIKTPPARLPVDVAELRERMRLDSAEEDMHLDQWIRAATDQIDGPDGIGFAMVAQVWTLTLDRFAAVIRLPGAPITAVSEIRYTDTDGLSQILDPGAYDTFLSPEPTRVLPSFGTAWPTTRCEPSAVQIDYALGQSNPKLIDRGLRTAVCLLAAHYYHHREAGGLKALHDIPHGVAAQLDRFRRGRVANFPARL